MLNRRGFIGVSLGVIAVLGAGKGVAMGIFDKKEHTGVENFPFQLSDDEWKKRLSPDAYRVLRQHGTERAFTSPLNDEHRQGIFHCAGCDQALFSSETKFNSGTGWPSFFQPIDPKAVGTTTDYKIGIARTEVHCSNCGGHLGHVFEDGPKPTGLRYCMNGVCLDFKPS